MGAEMEVVQKNGELVTQEAPTPNELMLAARDAARALKAVIDSNDRPPVSFNGKQYLEFPHWQTLAKFYHCAVATEGAEFVDVGGVPGFRAKAIVIDENTGMKIGSAEAYCLRDEPNWKNKPMFQLASMAQTRAGSKALANKFRYVAIVAGYEPTPKEEMDGVDLKPSVAMPRAKIAPQVDPADDYAEEAGEPPEIDKTLPLAPSKDLASDKQRKMLFARSRNLGISEEELKQYIGYKFKIESTKDLRWKDVDDVVKWIDSHDPTKA